MGLFLGSLLSSIDLCVCSYARTRLFYGQWTSSLISGLVISPFLFIFLKIAEAISCLFWFHMNFCSRCVNYAIGILIGIALNLQIALGSR